MPPFLHSSEEYRTPVTEVNGKMAAKEGLDRTDFITGKVSINVIQKVHNHISQGFR
jgi:hypothetical protein